MNVPDPFDAEHTKIIELLSEQLVAGSQNDHSVISSLIKHMSDHFAEEVVYMRKLRYYRSREHEEDHDWIQELFLKLLPKLVNGSASRSEVGLFKDHLLTHMKYHDTLLIEAIAKEPFVK
jgi:hemerythrin